MTIDKKLQYMVGPIMAAGKPAAEREEWLRRFAIFIGNMLPWIEETRLWAMVDQTAALAAVCNGQDPYWSKLQRLIVLVSAYVHHRMDRPPDQIELLGQKLRDIAQRGSVQEARKLHQGLTKTGQVMLAEVVRGFAADLPSAWWCRRLAETLGQQGLDEETERFLAGEFLPPEKLLSLLGWTEATLKEAVNGDFFEECGGDGGFGGTDTPSLRLSHRCRYKVAKMLKQ